MKQSDIEVRKDRECIKCKHFWTCPGKPHRKECVNMEIRVDRDK